MSMENFSAALQDLSAVAEGLLTAPRQGKGEENTKDRLLEPLLDALGYGPEYRTLEGAIRSLVGATTWVDYLLRAEAGKHPRLMVEAKSLWEKNLWEKYQGQVLGYLRDYSLDIGTQEPVLWLVLTNFREWHILRLQDRQPFWSFTLEDLRQNRDLASRFYDCFERRNLPGNRLEAFYQEKHREELGSRFLGDLKIWRLILANGIYHSQPDLSFERIREGAQVILNRFLLIRLLESFSRDMPFNYLGRVYYSWQQNFPDFPFMEDLRRIFRHTWVGYNTELFQASWVDDLMIEADYLEPIILLNTVPKEGILYALTGTLTQYRSLYNYDFTTLTQDILGTAYEQFLAHQLTLTQEGVRIVENQQTRKQEGIFYTPDYIVKCIVQQTLEPWVKPIVDRAIASLEAGHFQDAYDIVCSLFDLKILDPACGSGSFLLGAFDYLIREVNRYNRACQQIKLPPNLDLFNHVPVQSLVNPEEQILVQMLHGVDRDPQAVLLAKLSLWTKLLRSRPGEYGKRNGALYSHLPALTLNIRAGDSLISAPRDLGEFANSLALAADLARQARDHQLSEKERNNAVERLTRLMGEMNQEITPSLTGFFASDESLLSVIRLLQKPEPTAKALDSLRLFLTGAVSGEDLEPWRRKNLPDWTSQELARVQSELMTLTMAVTEVMVKRPFNWAVEFPQIFDPRLPKSEQGFTVIIGNPPYFNVDATFGRGAAELKWLKFAYGDIYTDKTDILFYFFRRGYDLLKTGGDLSFIVSRAFIQGDKSAKLRGFLSQNTQITGIIDFLGHRVFNAGIATAIIGWRKQARTNQDSFWAYQIIALDQFIKNINSCAPQLFTAQVAQAISIYHHQLSADRWQISSYATLFNKIDQAGRSIRSLDLVNYSEGITSGRDSIFEGNFSQHFPADYWLHRVSTSSIDSFGCKPPETQILYYSHQTQWQSLPQKIKDYLQENRLELEARDVYQNKTSHYEWFHLHRPRYGMKSAKIIFPRRASGNKFFVDESGQYGFKSDTAAFIKGEATDINYMYYLCALLNSKVLEFRYRALGGIGKLTGKGMFEYFENQVGDLPIVWFEDPENNPDYQTLVSLSREAHEIWQTRYQLIATYRAKSQGLPHQMVTLNDYCRLTGDYALDLDWHSAEPNREGHLLSLRLEPLTDGFELWGEISEEEDWKEGERQWVQLATVRIKLPHLRRYLLAQLIYLTEFDSGFRRKQKLSKEWGNLVAAALNALDVHCYDRERFDNLRILEVIEQRVAQEIGRSDLETVLARQKTVRQDIDRIAYRLYGVEEHVNLIEQALTVVL
ncbi:MAG: N-6 DNA methylase [Cyanobacteria bacterium RI_101]|nr:N-6 DNA methylase [Cyanobacteria bacterium RI_101]